MIEQGKVRARRGKIWKVQVCAFGAGASSELFRGWRPALGLACDPTRRGGGGGCPGPGLAGLQAWEPALGRLSASARAKQICFHRGDAAGRLSLPSQPS